MVGLTGGFAEPPKSGGGAAPSIASSLKPADIEKTLNLFRHHARTGVCVLLYALLLWWRKGSKVDSPSYIVALQTALEKRFDTLASMSKDQIARLDQLNNNNNINGSINLNTSVAASTPKKYNS